MTLLNEAYERQAPAADNKPHKKVPKLSDTYMEEYSAFSQFIAKYGRSYATINEHEGKFETFRTNYRDIKEHNQRHAAGEVAWTKVVN